MAVINVIYMYKEDQRPYYLLLLHLNRLLRLHPLLPWTRFLVLHNLLSISAACRAKNLSGPKLERMKKLLVPTTTASSSRESLAWWCWWLAAKVKVKVQQRRDSQEAKLGSMQMLHTSRKTFIVGTGRWHIVPFCHIDQCFLTIYGLLRSPMFAH